MLTTRPAAPAAVIRPDLLARAHALGQRYPALASRALRAAGIVARGEIRTCDVMRPMRDTAGRAYCRHIVATAQPHHATRQAAYSISSSIYHPDMPAEYGCTCADATGTTSAAGHWSAGQAPYVSGLGIACKHVLAYLLEAQ